MSEDEFDDLAVLEALRAEVSIAAHRAETEDLTPRRGRSSRRLARRLPPRVLALAALLVLSTAAASAAGTLLALRGSVIPAPLATPPEQTPAPGSGRMAGFSVADPRPGGPRWTMRLATSRTGLLCSTAGQLVGGQFGIIGLDGRFRELSPDAADACSIVRTDAASLVGARVFDARRPADVRSVVSGVGGDRLRSVTIEAAGRMRTVAVHSGGTFMSVLAGLPEDLAIVVRLRYADGHVERLPFGVSALVLPDPDGGSAWRIESGVVSGNPTVCVSLRAARERRNPPSSPAACGLLGNPYHTHGAFFAVRRLTTGSGGPTPASPFGGIWRDTPPRLLVWGAAGHDVASITVRGPLGAARTGRFYRPNGSFAYMFGPHVQPGQVVVTVRFRDGRTLMRRASTNLRAIPGFDRKGP
ncbi:MAG TPA: hypothetical protein VHZ75_09810 [Solirubrobacteraceae bacterium]|nr:hypothetical protein [Solirubrobacteraceae bacterium]